MTGDDRKETEKNTQDKAETIKRNIDRMVETKDLHELAKAYYSSLKGLEDIFKEKVESVCQD
jgi:methylphosphotriester-DNA--protein-cysteine methyltransferase